MRGAKGEVAILVEDDYEDLELWYPFYRLIEAGYAPKLVGPEARTYKSKHGYPAGPATSVSEVSADSFLGLVIPGGYAPDRLRRHPTIIELVRSVFDRGGMIAAICHGGSLLASANVVRGRKVTSFFSIEVDLINAGARFIDNEVVVDGNLITSRRPDDLPFFVREILVFLGTSYTKSN